MKKVIIGFILGALFVGSINVYAVTQFIATIANFKVFVNGEEFKGTTGEILVVEGRTYLPLRDIGNALGISVEWNDELRQVEVGTPPTPINTLLELDSLLELKGDFSFYNLTTGQLAKMLVSKKIEDAYDIHNITPLMLDGNTVYYWISGYFSINENSIEWREQVFPFSLETFEFLPPIFQIEHNILAGQTGISKNSTFWLAPFPIENELFFIEISKDGAMLRSVKIAEETLHNLLGSNNPQLQEVSFSRNAFSFAVLESGIAIQYFIMDTNPWTSTLGLLTFDGKLQKIELPGHFSTFIFHDSYSNGLFIYPWLSEEFGYPSHLLFRLDGSTLQWSNVVNE